MLANVVMRLDGVGGDPDRVLIDEVVLPDGDAFAEILARNVPALNRELAGRLQRVVLKMCFEDGFFHADPHPGNVLVHAGQATLIDWGNNFQKDSAWIFAGWAMSWK